MKRALGQLLAWPLWLAALLAGLYLGLLALVLLLAGLGMLWLWYAMGSSVPGEMLLRWLMVYCAGPALTLVVIRALLRRWRPRLRTPAPPSSP